jgi:adenylate cyclase
MSQLHQLAAIVFTDIVGYTAMMQEDEVAAVENINRFRQTIETSVAGHNGTIIQYYGDGCLLLFNSSVNAVLFAKLLQNDFCVLPQLPVRIGIHMGDVLLNEGNVFGDVVNIAARIQALAPPGCIYISETVHENTKNKKEIKSRFIKQELLKNVMSPVGIYEVPMVSAEVDFPMSQALVKNYFIVPVNSIAVLPFLNMSNDPEQEYFSEGMAEEIINSLTHLQDLKVAGRMSAFQFKGKNESIKEIGEKLGVNSILEGSIRKQGNRLRITAQLINVDDGFHIWSEKYDREMNDIFAIQDEIALSITEKLKLVLLKKDRDKITKSHTQNPEAYELYLKGRFHLNRRGASIPSSIQYFQKAIDTDPDFALAYAGYADGNLVLANYGLVPPKLIMAKAKQAAEKAIQLDPSLPEPYCSLGFYYTLIEWNWPEAKKNFLHSLELNPRYMQAHSWYGWNYLTIVEGKFEEGKKHGEILVKLEPLSAYVNGTYSLILCTVGKLKQALEVCRAGIELDANSFICMISEGNILLAMQRYEESIASFKRAMKISNRHHFAVNGLIWNYCLTGNVGKARSLMNELKERAEKEYIAKTFTALSAAYLGDMDEAFDYLEKAYNDRDPILLNLRYENWGPPRFRDDPRFQKLLERIGFPE